MRDLIKIVLVLGLAFASTFVFIKATGLLTTDDIRSFVVSAHDVDRIWLVLVVISLLWIDLLIAIPTMLIILLAGYFLGAGIGGAAGATGLMCLGVTGYAIGRRLGRPLLLRIYRSEQRLSEIERAFARNDLLVLFACQALPILPELSCCLAGISRMPFARFLFGYFVGVVPFAFIIAWAGSASTLADPSPAIYTSIGLSVVLLLIWNRQR
mgnify:CR=1 FL=1